MISLLDLHDNLTHWYNIPYIPLIDFNCEQTRSRMKAAV